MLNQKLAVIAKHSFFAIFLGILSIFMIAVIITACSDSSTEPEAVLDEQAITIARGDWRMASKPAQLDETYSRARMNWYNPYNRISGSDIWDRDLEPGEETVNIFVIDFDPSAVATDHAWAGIMRYMGNDSINTNLLDVIKIRFKGTKGIIHLEMGKISEDIDGDGIFDNEDVATQGRGQNGILDQGEDVGLDGLADEFEPGYDPVTNPDPSHDNWYYDGYGIGCNGCGPYDYSHINGTEGNGNDPAMLGRPDSEDLNGNNILNTENAYISFKIDLSDISAWPSDSAYNGWRTVYIPYQNGGLVDTSYGNPYWMDLDFVRIWLESPTGEPFYIMIAEALFRDGPDYWSK